jgi:superfamily II DNA/RNA helicase
MRRAFLCSVTLSTRVEASTLLSSFSRSPLLIHRRKAGDFHSGNFAQRHRKVSASQTKQINAGRPAADVDDVESAVRELLGASTTESQHEDNGKSSSPLESSDVPTKNSLPSFDVKVFDKFGMKAPPPRVPISDDPQHLLPVLPDVLRDHVKQHCSRMNIKRWTLPQSTAMGLILEGRDVLCISPTSSGKTMAFLIPSLMQILAHAGHTPGMSMSGDKDSENVGSSDATSQNLSALTRQRIATGEVCKFCEMDVFKTPICSFTGHPHRIPNLDEDAEHRRATDRIKDLSAITEPKLLIIVPTNELVTQVATVAGFFRCGFKIWGVSNDKQFARNIEDSDIVVITPQKAVHLLLRNKLTLRSVRVCVMDEVDSLLSTQFFDEMKVLMSSLPKGADRAQRLLFGATLPPPTFEMIRREMLLPSHRFILATPASTPISASTPSLTVANNSHQVTHTVLMVSRVEKLDVLFNLFETGVLRGDQRTIIFCQRGVTSIAHSIQDKLRQGTKPSTQAARTTWISSKQTASERESAMKLFQSGVATVLICSDLIGRGIDFHNVVSVVHFSMPLEIEQWVHRSGRCGRHGMKGYVISMFQPEDMRLAKPLVSILRKNHQLVPPKLQEYASKTFVDKFKNSLFHHPTKGYNPRNPEQHTPVIGRGVAKIPDYQRQAANSKSRPW